MTSEVIVWRRRAAHTAAMTLRTFLLIDSVFFDIAGIAALVGGATVLGIALLVVAAAVFAVFLAIGRRHTALA